MKFIINPKYKNLSNFIRNLPETFDKDGETLYQGRNLIKAFTIKDREVVVKHYKRPNFIQKIAYRWIRPSKASRAYTFALRLSPMGINTPEAIAYIEKCKFGLFLDSWFVSAKCNELPLLPELYETQDFNKKLATAFAICLTELHQKGFLHGDLNLANVFYRKENGKYHFTFIDINRSHFKPMPTQEDCLKNLMRITHRIDLLRYIITAYAIQRGWNAGMCCLKTEKYLHTFEKKRAQKYRLLKLFKR